MDTEFVQSYTTTICCELLRFPYDLCANFLTLLIATLKPQSNGPSYSNTVIGTLAIDGWAVTFDTLRRGLDGAAARPGPSSLYQL